MTETRIANLFNDGASQAVPLPVEFRFEGDEVDGDEVYVTRDDQTSDVVLSTRAVAKTWLTSSRFWARCQCRKISRRNVR